MPNVIVLLAAAAMIAFGVSRAQAQVPQQPAPVTLLGCERLYPGQPMSIGGTVVRTNYGVMVYTPLVPGRPDWGTKMWLAWDNSTTTVPFPYHRIPACAPFGD